MEISHQLLDNVRQIAWDAAMAILDIYETDFAVEKKPDRSPVTVADKLAHRIINEAITRLVPGLPVLSEEAEYPAFMERRGWHRYWLVDPLDGTREFIKKNGEFTVNIALIEDHLPTLGVVTVPVTGVCYYAGKSLGAYQTQANGKTRSLQTKRSALNQLVVADSRSYRNAKQHEFIQRLEAAEVITCGSSLKFCLIAEGRVDIYPKFGQTSEWDTAAAQCIVEEAGGSVMDMAFNPLRYNTKDSLLNPEFVAIADRTFNWQPYIEIVKSLDQQYPKPDKNRVE